jgi:cytochrome P450
MHARLRRLADLPSPPTPPFVGRWLGHLTQARPATMHRSMERWADQLGPHFTVRFGRTVLLGVADADALHQLLRDRPDGFRRTARLRAVADELGAVPGLFSAEGEQWRRQRKMVMAAFAPGAIRAYGPALQRVALNLQARWDRAARRGEWIDLAADLKRYTVDAIAGLAFGVEVNTLASGAEDQIQRHLDRVLAGLYRRAMSPWAYWRWLRTRRERELEASVVAVRQAIAGLVAQARQRRADDPVRRAAPPNLLEAMIAAADDPASGLGDNDVAGNVSTMLFAGEDTTANSLAWLIWLLQQNPAALARAHAEARALVGRSGGFAGLDPGALDGLEWLDACISESMRLEPVAPMLVLEALAPTRVADIEVPAGTLVWCLLRHAGTDPKQVADAPSFDPARWLPGAAFHSDTATRRLAMPFGGGARICPGRYLALQEMRLAMVMLLAGFDIVAVESADGTPVRETMQFTMNPTPLRMRLRPAEPA